MRGTTLVKAIVLLAVFGIVGHGAHAVTNVVDYSSQLTEKQQEIDALNKRISDLSAKRSETASEADAIALTLEQLKVDLQRANAQLEQTQATMTDVKKKSKTTGAQVTDLQHRIDGKKRELDALIRQLYEYEQVSLVQIFFDSKSLSDVFNQRSAYKQLQERAVRLLGDMHDDQDDLSGKKQALDQQASDLEQLQKLQDVQAQDLADKKSAQKLFLQQKKQQKAQYESLIAEAQMARDEIKKQVFTLQNGSIKISLNSANDMAKFAGKVTGVRPAVIIAVLKIESGVGSNLGSGRYPNSIASTKNRDAFLRITKALGIDPYTAPLSRSGAMGPAQIMPTTWEGMAQRIQTLMGKKLANPYELADAFVATGVFLADKGAQDPAREAEALQRYVGGIYWEGQAWYSRKVLAVAQEYEKEGL